MKRKYTLKDYFKLAKSKGFILLELEKTKKLPQNIDTDILIKCKECGYERLASFYKMQHYGCPKCNKRAKIIYKDYKELEKKLNIVFLNITKDNIPKKNNN